MNRGALIDALIRIAVRIGRWLIQHAARKGVERLIGYMDGKIGDFKRRLARAKKAARIEWLKGRIARWTAAVKWLITHGPTLAGDALKGICKLPAVRALPLVAREEVCPA